MGTKGLRDSKSVHNISKNLILFEIRCGNDRSYWTLITTTDEQVLELHPKLQRILGKHKWLKVSTRIVRGNICQLLLYHDEVVVGYPSKKALKPKVHVVELTQNGDFLDEYEVILDLAKHNM